MRGILTILLSLLVLACSPIAKNTVAKKIGDNTKAGVEEFKKGNLITARVFLEDALRDAYAVDNLQEAVNVLQNLTEVCLAQNDLSNASRFLNSAWKFARSADIKAYELTLLITSGKLSEKNEPGAIQKTLQYYNDAYKLAKNDEERAVVLNNRARASLKNNLLDEAVKDLEQSKKWNQNSKNIALLADNCFNLGDVYERKLNYELARKFYLDALSYDRQVEKSGNILADLKKLGAINQKLGWNQESADYYERALNTAKALNLKNEIEEIEEKLTGLVNPSNH